jgi:hypothetical protein
MNAVPSKKADSVYLLPHGALVKRYLLMLRASRKIPKKINISDGKENVFFRECAEELGIIIDEKAPIFKLTDNGQRVFAILDDGKEIPYWQLLMICCIEGRKRGIILPRDTPNAVERILKRHSIDVAFYSDSDSEERRLAGSDRLPRDGIVLALTSAWISEQTGQSLRELADKLPPFSVSTRNVFTDRDKMTSIIARLREENGNGRSAGFDFGEGRVSVFACASGRFRLVAEAVDSENVITIFDDIMAQMTEARIPVSGRILYVTPDIMVALKNAVEINRSLDVRNGGEINRSVTTLDGVPVIYDYAHHPKEIHAAIDTLEKMRYNKIYDYSRQGDHYI